MFRFTESWIAEHFTRFIGKLPSTSMPQILSRHSMPSDYAAAGSTSIVTTTTGRVLSP